MRKSSDYLVHQLYKENYKKYLEQIKSNNVVAFMGAGLSKKHGFKSWQELILGLDSDNRKICSGLVDIAQLDKKSWEETKNGDEYDLIEIAEKCLQNMSSDEWSEFIKTEFGDISKIDPRLSDPYMRIFSSNYYAFITTNYDGCALIAGKEKIKNIPIGVYPKNITGIVEKSLSYIHGAGFPIIEHYDPQIILTKSQYDNAYTGITLLKIYIDLMRYHSIFIGFSMNDLYIKKILDTMKRGRQELINANKEYPKDFFDRDYYILLPMIYNNETKTVDIEETLKQDGELTNYGLKIIRYNGTFDEPHKFFEDLVNDICDFAPFLKIKSEPTALSLDEFWR